MTRVMEAQKSESFHAVQMREKSSSQVHYIEIYFHSKFLEISKPIHFWNHQSTGYPKIRPTVGICVDTIKAAILDFQNGRHIIHILRYLGF